MRCDNCRCLVTTSDCDTARLIHDIDASLCPQCATGMVDDAVTCCSRLIEQEELQAWCAEHAGEAMAGIVDDCPPCLDYYPEVDIDGDLTGEIVHAQDDDYQMFQNDDRTQCVVRKN